jgi:hypothetical protein
MARKRSFLGKKPGGRSRGVPGNPSVGVQWGGTFRKRGEWGMLDPREWIGFGTRMSFGKDAPRPQGQLQQVIDYNLGLEGQMGRGGKKENKQQVASAGAAAVAPAEPKTPKSKGKVKLMSPMQPDTTMQTTSQAAPKSAPKAKQERAATAKTRISRK